MILNNQSEMQMKTFLDISMSQHELLLQGNSKQATAAVLEELRDKPSNVIQSELRDLLSNLQARLDEYMEDE